MVDIVNPRMNSTIQVMYVCYLFMSPETAKELDECIRKHAGSSSDDAEDIGNFYNTNRERVIRIVELFVAEKIKEG